MRRAGVVVVVVASRGVVSVASLVASGCVVASAWRGVGVAGRVAWRRRGVASRSGVASWRAWLVAWRGVGVRCVRSRSSLVSRGRVVVVVVGGVGGVACVWSRGS
ncbi:hypothetical protein ACXZ9C_10950 [Streptococcus agalactiae]